MAMYQRVIYRAGQDLRVPDGAPGNRFSVLFGLLAESVGKPGAAGEILHDFEGKRNRGINTVGTGRHQYESGTPGRMPQGEPHRCRSTSRDSHYACFDDTQRIHQCRDKIACCSEFFPELIGVPR